MVHDPAAPADQLLSAFGQTLSDRGFRVVALLREHHQPGRNPGRGRGAGGRLPNGPDEGEARLLVRLLGSDQVLSLPHRGSSASAEQLQARATLRTLFTSAPDLIIVSRFAAFLGAAGEALEGLTQAMAAGTPVLTSIAGGCLTKWHGFAGSDSALLAPTLPALWHWWGPDRLYRDLVLGVPERPARRIVLGSRSLMVEGPDGAGVAYLPKQPAPLHKRLPQLRRLSLRGLAQLALSWDPLEVALGVAAINAHYNRYDLEAAPGNGVEALRGQSGRITCIGSFPGLAETLPQAQVLENQPRAGELPLAALETLLPGSAAVVARSSSLINRTLPRMLQLARGARLALIGSATPLAPRLHDYGIESLGGFLVRDADGLAAAVAAGAGQRDFDRFGVYVHRRQPPPLGITSAL